jgi:outer membrane protein assembly factor BamB
MKKHTLPVIVLLFSAALGGQDWNQWRGPSRTGVTSAFKAPATWPERPKQMWKVQAGAGHSSPIVSGGRVYLFSRINDQEALTAYDLATGKQLWRQTYDAPYQMNPAATSHGKGPKSTPVFDRDRVFTFGISGVLSAWDAKAGAVLWRKDFQKDFPTTTPDFGVAMSPIVAADKLIVHAGGGKGGAILALEPATGKEKWVWKGDGPAYASPIVATIDGVVQVVTQSQSHVVSLSVADGKLLWQIPFTTEYDQNIVTPVVIGDRVIFSGVAKPLVGYTIARSGGQWSAKQSWQNEALPMYMSSPVASGEYLYGLSQRNRGQFFCVDAQTGKTLWTTRGREGENAAMALAGDLLFVTTTEGELVIARASPKAFEVVKRYTIAESPVWAHPAPAGNGVLIKDAESLAYWTF